MTSGTCRVCQCTDFDCWQCIEKTGEACSWVEPDLCSACMPGVRLREQLDEMVARGDCTKAEADVTFQLMDELSDQELRGEITTGQALAKVAELGLEQLRRRRSVS